ncbi:MAG: hypothetical protein FJ388_05610 [Verrucomicrobia bacterium]|nr:hypothetical protein [Verrucomicrobiota bacterium]
MTLRLPVVAPVCALAAAFVAAQTSAPVPPPAKSTAINLGVDVPLVEKPWEKLSHKRVSEVGTVALGDDPKAWRHAETEHFAFHYRQPADAQKVVRLAEYFYQQIKADLGVTQDRFIRKNHVFVFDDEAAWKKFLEGARFDGYAMGFAVRSELFLFNPEGRSFVIYLLAHEMTHGIFYRFVPRAIPLWLNEGFAEFEAMHVIARSQGKDERRIVGWGKTDFPLQELVRATKYPKEKRGQFYAASERLVRFLITGHDRSKFLPLVNMLAEGTKFEDAVLFIHHDKYKTFAAFEEAYKKFDPLAAWR